MSRNRKPLNWFIIDMMRLVGIPAADFRRLYNISKSTWFHWLSDGTRWDDPPIELLRAFSDFLGLSVGRVLDYWDQGTLRLQQKLAEPIDFKRLKLRGLLTKIYSEEELNRTLEKAINGKHNYCEGNFLQAIDDYRKAIDLAVTAQQLRLALYLRIQLLNVYEMTSQFSRATDVYDQVRTSVAELFLEARRGHNKELARVAFRLKVMAECRWLWLDGWAKGVTPASLDRAYKLREQLREYRADQYIPCIDEFIARCHVGLGNYAEAVKRIRDAEHFAYGLNNSTNIQNEWFLDVGCPLPDGKTDYLVQQDMSRTATLDVSVSANEMLGAARAYRSIVVHDAPEASWGIHRFWDVSLQKMIRSQEIVAVESDVKQRLSPEEYDERLKASGDRRIRALNLLALGEYFFDAASPSKASQAYQTAKDVAWTCQAPDIYIRANLGIVQVAISQKDRRLAESKLHVIQETLHTFDNPYLRQQFHQAEDTVLQIAM